MGPDGESGRVPWRDRGPGGEPNGATEPIEAFRSWLQRWSSADALASASPPTTPEPSTRDHRAHAARAVEQAREALAQGDRSRAWSILERDLRDGGWGEAAVWIELVSLVDGPSGYEAVRRVWLSSRPRANRHPVILAAVAASACDAGEHHEARTLLRRAILQAWRIRAGRTGASDPRLTGKIVRPSQRDGDADSTGTAAYFDLLEAVATGDESGQQRHVQQLRSLEEGDWLDRL